MPDKHTPAFQMPVPESAHMSGNTHLRVIMVLKFSQHNSSEHVQLTACRTNIPRVMLLLQ
jgi:hypothetical protein